MTLTSQSIQDETLFKLGTKTLNEFGSIQILTSCFPETQSLIPNAQQRQQKVLLTGKSVSRPLETGSEPRGCAPCPAGGSSAALGPNETTEEEEQRAQAGSAAERSRFVLCAFLKAQSGHPRRSFLHRPTDSVRDREFGTDLVRKQPLTRFKPLV